MKYVYVPEKLKEKDELVKQYFKSQPIQIVRALEFELMTEMKDEYGFTIQVPIKRKADYSILDLVK